MQKFKKREYYEQVYDNKLDNLEEREKFLKTYSPPKLNQEHIDNLNRLITRSKLDSVIKTTTTTIPYKQKSRTRWLKGEFYQT